MTTIEAIYENGVFRPIHPVKIPEHSRVTLHAEVSGTSFDGEQQGNAAVWDILSHCSDTGNPFLAEGHDEHQP